MSEVYTMPVQDRERLLRAVLWAELARPAHIERIAVSDRGGVLELALISRTDGRPNQATTFTQTSEALAWVDGLGCGWLEAKNTP